MGWMEVETGLDRCRANFVPLTPLSHLKRANEVFPELTAVVQGSRRFNYRDYFNRVTLLASAIRKGGVAPGGVVATLLPNIAAHAEAHFGVPASGAVLNAINTRLEAGTVAYILEHGGASILLVDTQLVPLAEEALAMTGARGPRIVEVADPEAGFPATGNHLEYEDFLATGDRDFAWHMPEDEWESLALNYTSGTTGRPKGVVYHHRGAYLMTMGTVVSWRMTLYPKFLAVVPLFHCNGWNHSWMLPLLGGTFVSCRNINAGAIYDAIADEEVTHLGGAPIVLNMLANATADEKRQFDHTVEVFTAGAPPAAATLRAIEDLNFNVTHVYGLTETYGHVTECIRKPDWDELGREDIATLKARQGVLFPMMDSIEVVDPATRRPVARNGTALGEIVMRGNAVMKGYYKNRAATEEAFEGGVFWTGDIAVQYPDGYIRIADRSKDIIISGGENVSSVEVESTLMEHPAVSLCAVVAKPDDKWGEVPCAFVELKDGRSTDEQSLIAFCRSRLSGFKTPKHVYFEALPKTSTGKIQKFQLREVARSR